MANYRTLLAFGVGGFRVSQENRASRMAESPYRFCSSAIEEG